MLSAFHALPALAVAAPLAIQAAPLAQQIELNAQRYAIAGQSVLVARNGEVIFRRTQGVRDDAVFPAYSVSKLLASVLVLQLVEAGTLDLDRPAASYAPGLPPRWQHITLRNLLNHTSGLPEYFDSKRLDRFPPTAQAAFDALADQPLVFAAGTSTRYAQTNFLVLAAVLEQHYGQPYQQLAKERIIDKLGLKRTCLGPACAGQPSVVPGFIGKDGKLQAEPPVPWPAYASAHAELYTTSEELAAFLHAVMRGELVGKDTLRKLWQPGKLSNGQDGWFAAGWEIGASGGYRFVGHDGGAKVRVRLLWPDAGTGDSYTIVYLTNGSARNVWSRTLVESVMAGIDPQRFHMEAISEQLIGYATQPSSAAPQALMARLRAAAVRDGGALERRINETGYAMLETRGSAAAIKVFELNTRLFPQSANARDSLAQARAAGKLP